MVRCSGQGRGLWWACRHLSPGLAEWLVRASPSLALHPQQPLSLSGCLLTCKVDIVTVSEWRFSQGAEGSTLHRTGTFLSTGYYFYYSILKGNDGNLKTVRCHRVEDASCRDLWGMCLEQHWSFSFLFSLGISRFRVKHNAASSMIQSLRSSKWMDLKIKNPKQSCIFPNTNDDFYLVPGFNRD